MQEKANNPLSSILDGVETNHRFDSLATWQKLEKSLQAKQLQQRRRLLFAAAVLLPLCCAAAGWWLTGKHHYDTKFQPVVQNISPAAKPAMEKPAQIETIHIQKNNQEAPAGINNRTAKNIIATVDSTGSESIPSSPKIEPGVKPTVQPNNPQELTTASTLTIPVTAKPALKVLHLNEIIFESQQRAMEEKVTSPDNWTFSSGDNQLNDINHQEEKTAPGKKSIYKISLLKSNHN